MPVLCCSYAFLFHLVVSLQIIACISLRSLLRPVSLHLVVLPNDLMYILAQPVAPCMFRAALLDSVSSSRAAGGVNYRSVISVTTSTPVLCCFLYSTLFDLAVSPNPCMYILAQLVAPCIASFYLVVLPNNPMYILAQPVAPCMFRAALRTVCTVHGLLVESDSYWSRHCSRLGTTGDWLWSPDLVVDAGMCLSTSVLV
ncbi:hypothetical protein EV421DRAFT_1220614 [Armillaria borealis]|uniref:Uncharacterized protein n=1 Tax=Armillaria borealis TaxID=47425 RepID=A0AA39J545_9AGAR|nr:hypothetical protein EV421DRAFT_1220614 [Armillaria borealis]